MKGTRSALLAILATVAACAAGQDADYAASPANYITYRSRAFLVAPPVLICGPKVVSASWSPDGLFMLIQQQTAATSVRDVEEAYNATVKEREETLVKLYSLGTGLTSDLMRLDSKESQIAQVQWIPSSDRAFMVVLESSDDSAAHPQAKLYGVNAVDGTADPLRPWNSTEKPVSLDLFPSTTQAYAFVRSSFGTAPEKSNTPAQGDTNKHELALLNAEGKYVLIRTPDGYKDVLPLWSKDGTKAYAFARPRAGEGKKLQWYQVSLSNGALSEASRPADLAMGEGQLAALLSVREVRTASTNGSLTRSIQNVWLETVDPDAQNRLLLAGDAREGAVSRTLSAASYITQDSLFMRPIIEVPKSKFDEAVVMDKRRVQMARAKNAGLALLMFSQDNDDILPADRKGINELLGPYLAPGFSLDDFVYTFQGGPINDLKNPSATQLGYIDAGDGLAVIYADGHVQWKPKSPGG